MSQINIRSVFVNGRHYLRAEDVSSYIQELAGAEETDTRNRLIEAARNLLQKP